MSFRLRILLALILSFFLLGLAAHTLPEISLCACIDSPAAVGVPMAADTCLVCLLQAGISLPDVLLLTMHASQLRPSEHGFGSPLRLASRITHPPTLSAE